MNKINSVTTSSQTLIIGYVFWRSFDDSIYI